MQLTSRVFRAIGSLIDSVNLIRLRQFGFNYLDTLFCRNKPSLSDLVERSEKGLAARIVEYFPSSTWGNGFYVVEVDNDVITAFEKEVQDLVDNFNLIEEFTRLDMEAGTGHYSCLMLGIGSKSGEMNFEEPLPKDINNQLLWVRVFHESQCQIEKIDEDPTSKRWGFPVLYKVYPYKKINSYGKTSADQNRYIFVHYSWIIHFSPNAKGSGIYGQPDLAKVWDYLHDLELVSGSFAQIYFKNARSWIVSDVKEEFTLDPTEKEKFKAEVKDAQDNLDTHIVTEGYNTSILNSSTKPLAGEIGCYITLIATTLGISQRVFSGTEEGKLAGEQDRRNTGDVARRRRERVGAKLVRAFLEILFTSLALKRPSASFRVEFAPEDEMTMPEKIKALVDLSAANKNQRDANGEMVLETEEMRDLVLGWSSNEKSALKGRKKDRPIKEVKVIAPAPNSSVEPGLEAN